MNQGDKFVKFAATEDAKEKGYGKELADKMINPEKYRKKLLKSAMIKMKKKKAKIRKIKSLKKFGRSRLKMPKIKLKHRKRLRFKLSDFP